MRRDSPTFVFSKRKGVGLVGLGTLQATDVVESGFFRRVDLERPDEGRARIFFAHDGPSAERLRAEFIFT